MTHTPGAVSLCSELSVGSYSSSISPTSSSTMSSSVTMPAGPPYSSITRAISVECVRSSERTTVRLAASGTAITWCISECTSTASYSVRSTPSRSFAWTIPCTLPSGSTTGKRDRRDAIASRRSAAVALPSIVTTLFQATIASEASSSAKSMARSSRPACRMVRCPDSADESTIRSSSSVDTAPWSSSTGSMPNTFRSRFADPSNSRMTGPATFMKSSVEPATARATGSGLAIARFFGASSPNTICAIVARTNAMTSETPNDALAPTPTASSTGSIAPAIAGRAMKPRTSDVTVMPSWAPDSMKLNRLWTASARIDFLSPSSAPSANFDRRDATICELRRHEIPVCSDQEDNGNESERGQQSVRHQVSNWEGDGPRGASGPSRVDRRRTCEDRMISSRSPPRATVPLARGYGRPS